MLLHTSIEPHISNGVLRALSNIFFSEKQLIDERLKLLTIFVKNRHPKAFRRSQNAPLTSITCHINQKIHSNSKVGLKSKFG